YGVVSTFPLRDGHLYEVQQTAGTPSKRHVVRRFYWLEGGELEELEPEDALRRTVGGANGAPLRVRAFPRRTLVTDLTDAAAVVPFCTLGPQRLYWLLEGREYDVRDVDRKDCDRCRVIRVENGELHSKVFR